VVVIKDSQEWKHSQI